jgi:hypothetical protein
MTQQEIETAANTLADDIVARAQEALRLKPELTKRQAIEIAIELWALDIDERNVS